MYYGGVFDWDNAKKQLAYLNEEIVAPNFWDDAEKAQQTLRKQQFLDSNINKLTNYQNNLLHIIELIDLAELENDEDLLKEGEVSLLNIQKELKEVQIEFLLNGETDGNDAYLEIHPGAGGTESQDWASMLLRMYLRWAEKKSFKTQLIDMQNADEAGIKSATILIKGTNAYGLLKTESGVHRLVRISPFDSNARRHTSFASIWVYPVIDENIAVEIAPNEVRIDTYRASGAGGQHVNTTDSAVRITHIPTGIVVQCQSERSQHKNKATAWNMLRARLYEEEVKKQQLEADVIQANKSEIGWGQQIRSYILQPYQLVKDTRTKIEHTNPQSVLDGDLDSFIKAALASQTY